MQFADGTSRHDIERIGHELQSERFIFIDEDTEEVMIRSFIRHDGLLKNPKITVSMVNAYGAIASNKIREVFIHELIRMHTEQPELKAFENTKVIALLKNPARPMQEFTQGFTPSILDDLPEDLPQGLGEGLPKTQGNAFPLPTTTATTTSSKEDREATQAPATPAKKRGSRITEDWMPQSETVQKLKAEFPHIDQKLEHRKFIDHWLAESGAKASKLDWEATYRNWIRRSAEYNPAPLATAPSPWDQKGIHQ